MNALTLTNSQLCCLEVSSSKIVEDFLNVQDIKQSSKNLYRRTLKQFFRWLDKQQLSITKIKREEILQYKEWLTNNGFSHLTVDSYLSSVRRFFEWMEAKCYYPNIAKGIKIPKKEKGFKKDVLT